MIVEAWRRVDGVVRFIGMLGQMAVALRHKNGPINDHEHEAVHVNDGVEQAEVEASARMARLLGWLHEAKETGLPSCIVGVGVGPVKMGQGPAERHGVVEQNHDPGDGRELEEETPSRVLVIPVESPVDEYAGDGEQVDENKAADVAKDVLVKPFPRRMTGPKKDGLHAVNEIVDGGELSGKDSHGLAGLYPLAVAGHPEEEQFQTFRRSTMGMNSIETLELVRRMTRRRFPSSRLGR
jgi:hypothetical protein